MMKKKYISVFMPVYNGEKYLGESINAILSQELPEGYSLELLITDSGSTDNSVEIIKAYGDKINFDQIPNSEFGHGKTRQRAAEKAKGEYILFITQDATPTDTRWIINMIEPFRISERIGCVFGRQIPRPFAPPTIKREVAHTFQIFGPENSIILHNLQSLIDDHLHTNYNYFFSDVNSAIRKDLVKVLPFRDIKYAEDQALAHDMLNAGYIKAYSPRGAVWHSNEYTITEYRMRKYDEYHGLKNSVGFTVSPSIKRLLLGWIRPTLHDIMFLLRDREYNKRAKMKFFAQSFAYNISSMIGEYQGSLSSAGRHSKLSLEESRKK